MKNPARARRDRPSVEESGVVAASNLYEAIFIGAPDALLIIDERGKIVTANAQAERLFGWTVEQLKSSGLAQLVPERFRGVHDQHVRKFLAAPSARPMGIGMELWAKRADGREIPVEISLSPVETREGRFVAAAIRDVSRQQERFRLLVEGVRDYALYMIDTEGRVVSWNAGAENIKGYSAAEAIGLPVARFYTPEDIEAGVPQEITRRAVEDGHSLEEGWRLRKDGSRFWASVLTTPLYDADDRLRGFSKLVRDETERQQLISERERALRWFRTVIDTCPVGLLLFQGPTGSCVEANGAAIEMIGRPLDPTLGREQYFGKLCRADGSAVPPEGMPGLRALRGEVIAAGEEYLLERTDGRIISVLISAAPVMGEGRRIAGAIAVFDDITELTNLRRLREEWTAVVAHDLRQPLNVISMQAQVVDHFQSEDKTVKKAMGVIGTCAKRLDRMIHDLLDLELLEASKMHLDLRPVAMERLVRGAADNTSTVAKGRRVIVSVRGTVPVVSADEDRIHQILDNLLTNALRYGDAGEDVIVEIEGDPDRVSVSVTNRGQGIAPELMPKLFKRFGAGASGLSDRQSVGLGLYITKGLVEAHGGHIEVASTPGKTTTFRFTIPSATAR